MALRIGCFSLLMIFASCLFFGQDIPANSNSKERDPKFQESAEKANGCPYPPNLLCAYNYPGRIEVNSNWDICLSGSYIFWQPREKGLEYGYFYPADTAANTLPLDMHFHYCSGFKISACSNFDHDGWTVLVEYSRVHHNHKNVSASRLPSDGYFIPANIYYSQVDNLSTNNHASYCKSKWKFGYDMIDLEIGRPCYIGLHLILNPFFGARGGWIEQKTNEVAEFTNLEIGQTGIIAGRSYCKTNSWLLGPRVGIDSNWLLGYHLKLLGNFSASLDYQLFKTSFKQANFTQAELLDINAKDKIGYVTPNIETSIGFGCGSYFDKSRWHVEISFLYDFIYFWNQNYMRYFSDKILRNIATKPGNLALHGLTVQLKFDF